MQIGNTIRKLRLDHGLSQEALAEQLHVSRQAVSKWEKGLSYPSTENLLTLAELFDVSADDLAALQIESKEALPQEPSPPQPRKRPWGLAVGAALLLLVGLVCGVHFAKNAQEAPAAKPTLQETSEFALNWKTETGWSFLALGPQERLFPFGRDLVPSEREQVRETDFGPDWVVHVVPCGPLTISYSQMKEEGQEHCSVDRITTITPGYQTPRGIQVGSDAQEVLTQYQGELVYALKEHGEEVLCPHDFLYIYAPEEAFGTAILFYLQDGHVAGLSVQTGDDSGNEAFQVNHRTIFPLRDGKPDFRQRQEVEQEPIDQTRAVYIALTELEEDGNLSEEEQFQRRQTIYAGLPELDWAAYGALGEAGQEDQTREALLFWLLKQEALSQQNLRALLLGGCRPQLEGTLLDLYAHVLAQAFLADPAQYLHCLTEETFSQEQQETLLTRTAAGCLDADNVQAEARAALQALESGPLTPAERRCQQALLDALKG